MNCEEILHFLDPLLDNELPVEESARILHHLDSCLDCQEQWDKLGKLRTRIHASINDIKVPTNLESSLRKAVDKSSESAPQRNRKRFTALSAIAAALLGFLYISKVQLGNPLSAMDIIQEENVQSSKTIAQNDLNAQNSVALAGWTLVAQKECQMGKVPAQRFSFKNDSDPNKTLSLYRLKRGQFDAAGMIEHQIDGNKICCGELGKTALIFCPSKDHDNVLISSIPLDDLMSLTLKNHISTT